MTNINDLFVSALKFKLDQSPRGTLAKLAKAIGVSSQTIIKTMRWGRTPQEDERRATAEFFECSYDNFLNIGRRELGLIPPEPDTKLGGDTVTISRDEYEALKSAASQQAMGQTVHYGSDLGEIKELLAAQIEVTKETQAERDKRMEELIESLKEGIRSREDRIDGLQRKFDVLLSEHKADNNRMAETEAHMAETIDFLKGQVKYYQDDGERLKGMYEIEKRAVEAKDAEISQLREMVIKEVN